MKNELTGFPSVDMPWRVFYPPEGLNFDYPREIVYDLIYEANKERQDAIAIEYFGRKIRYGDFFCEVEKASAALVNIGVKEGDIVTLLVPTTPEVIYLFYGLSRIGAISNLIDPRTSSEGIKHYLDEAESKLLVTLDLVNDKIYDLIPQASVEKVVTISLAASAKHLPGLKLNIGCKLLQLKTRLRNNSGTYLSYSDFIAGAIKKKPKSIAYKPDHPLTIAHTGGTTGLPKGVLLSHDNFNAMAYQYYTGGIETHAGDKFLNIMPPFIAYGSDMIHMPLVKGMHLILMPTFDPKSFDRYILKYRPQHFAGVPNHYDQLVQSKRIQKADLSFIKTAAVGGDKMNVALQGKVDAFLKSRGVKTGVTPGYSLTEATSIFAASIGEHSILGGVGFPVPGANVKIIDDQGNELTYRQNGQVCVNTPTIMLGYHKNQKATDEILKVHDDGKTWIHTGDLGSVTEEGFLIVDGRIKRMIIRYDGFKVYPFAIESVIQQHEDVKDCIVVGIPDFDYVQGEKPKVHIILKDGTIKSGAQIQAEIQALCERSLQEYQVPHDYKFRAEFPYTSIGKIDTIALQEEDAARGGAR
ncbi:MAG: acyl--CoA ligase [Coriobacteriia bacterium]|nr:acyl--CoA ligase [Coriobacteriia bacterium]